MGIKYNTSVVRDGLVLHLDAANVKSYPGSGTTWKDLSGNGNDGTLENGPTYSSDNKGNFSFDGVNDYASVTNNSSLNPTSEFTISCWFKLKTIESAIYPSLVIKASDGQSFGADQYGLWLWRGGLIDGLGVGFRANISNITRTLSSGTDLDDVLNKWSMAVGCYDGSNMKLIVYHNGNKVIKTSSVSGTVGTNTSNLIVGKNGDANNSYCNAEISNVQIYNRALTEAEIQQNFEATRGRYGI